MHWILIAISIPLKVIKICDSVLYEGSKVHLPVKCLIDVEKFLKYYYPDIAEEWTHEIAQDEDRFQSAEKNEVDCGYHLINYMEGASSNMRIQANGSDFVKFKCRVETEIEEERQKIRDETAELDRRRAEQAITNISNITTTDRT